MSFNVRYGDAEDGEYSWPYRREAAIHIVKSFAPDIVALQEALYYQVEEFLAAMPDFASIGVGRDDGDKLGEFASLLYDTRRLSAKASGTFWLCDDPSRPGSRHPECYHPRVCVWAHFEDRATGCDFRAFNLHLDNESSRARIEGVELVLRANSGEAGLVHLDAGAAAIVMGDFNAGEMDPCVEAMRAAGFRDSFRVVNPGASDVATYHGFGSQGNPEKIDYIWVDGAWSVLEAAIVCDRVESKWPSDHFPVVAILGPVGGD